MLFQHGFVRLELATSIRAPTTVVDDDAFTLAIACGIHHLSMVAD